MTYYTRRRRYYYRKYWSRRRKVFKNKFNMNYYNYIANINTQISAAQRTFTPSGTATNKSEIYYQWKVSTNPWLPFTSTIENVRGFNLLRNCFSYFRIRAWSVKVIPDQNNFKNQTQDNSFTALIGYYPQYTMDQLKDNFNTPTLPNTNDENYAVLCKPMETTYKYHYLRSGSSVWHNTAYHITLESLPDSFGSLYLLVNHADGTLPANTTPAKFPKFFVQVKLYITFKSVDV